MNAGLKSSRRNDRKTKPNIRKLNKLIQVVSFGINFESNRSMPHAEKKRTINVERKAVIPAVIAPDNGTPDLAYI